MEVCSLPFLIMKRGFSQVKNPFKIDTALIDEIPSVDYFLRYLSSYRVNFLPIPWEDIHSFQEFLVPQCLNRSTGGDIIMIVDISSIIYKFVRWRKLFPRVKPFYGKFNTGLHARYLRELSS